METLQQGAKGPDVVQLQRLLNRNLDPSPQLDDDGDFGQATQDAVLRFQQLRGLAADGVVAAPVWLALGQTPESESSSLTDAPDWLQIAAAELGVHEISSPGQNTARIVEYHNTTTLKATDDETPWCSSFVNWVMIKTGRRGTNSAAAKSWLEWGQAVQPQAGAVTVLKKKVAGADAATGSSSGWHVAFLISATPTSVRLLGGNQSNSVKYSNFSLEGYDVKGYRMPK